MTQVHWSIRFTANLGNYETLTLEAGVEDQVRNDEGVQAASDRVYKFVENELMTKVREIKKTLNNG